MANQDALALLTMCKDPVCCSGAFNQATRDSLIRQCRSSVPADQKTVCVQVDSQQPCEERMHKFFVCFGFLSRDPFMVPGTIVEFCSTCEGGGSKECSRRSSTVTGCIVAIGRRPQVSFLFVHSLAPPFVFACSSHHPTTHACRSMLWPSASRIQCFPPMYLHFSTTPSTSPKLRAPPTCAPRSTT